MRPILRVLLTLAALLCSARLSHAAAPPAAPQSAAWAPEPAPARVTISAPAPAQAITAPVAPLPPVAVIAPPVALPPDAPDVAVSAPVAVTDREKTGVRKGPVLPAPEPPQVEAGPSDETVFMTLSSILEAGASSPDDPDKTGVFGAAALGLVMAVIVVSIDRLIMHNRPPEAA